MDSLKANGDLKFFSNSIDAYIVYRPLPSEEYLNDYEISDFTFYTNGCSIEICNVTTSHLKKHIPTCDRLVAKVITQHDLVSYYINKYIDINFLF